MRPYEIMVILDPTLDERTVAPSLDTFLNVIRSDGGSVDKVDIWGRRRLAYEIAKHAEGIYAIVDVKAEPGRDSDPQLSWITFTRCRSPYVGSRVYPLFPGGSCGR